MKLPVTLYLFLYTIIGSGCITLRSSAEHSCFCKLHEMRQLLAQTLLQLHQLLLQSLIGGMDKACQTYLTDSLPFDTAPPACSREAEADAWEAWQ